MVCLKPLLVKTGNSLQPYRYVPCGRCMACRINKTQEWVIRLEMEKMSNDKTAFVTLTYDDEHIPADCSLHKKDLQNFFKRLRKSGLSFRYYAVGEYGEKEQKYYDPVDEELINLGKINPHGRPHYHVLFFGVTFQEDEDFRLLQKAWFNCSEDYWNIHREKLVGSTDSGSIRYVCDYMQKKQYGLNSIKEYWNSLPPFSLSSQRLGLESFEKDLETYKENGFIMYNGHECPIPRYFRQKFEIEPNWKISENNFYRTLCLKKGWVKTSELEELDKLSELEKCNQYFLIVRDMTTFQFGVGHSKQEEMDNLIKRRNFLYSGEKL